MNKNTVNSVTGGRIAVTLEPPHFHIHYLWVSHSVANANGLVRIDLLCIHLSTV